MEKLMNKSAHLHVILNQEIKTQEDYTCGSSLQSRAMCSHHAWVSNQPWVSHSHFKRASRNVASIELDIYGVNAILPRNKADCTLV